MCTYNFDIINSTWSLSEAVIDKVNKGFEEISEEIARVSTEILPQDPLDHQASSGPSTFVIEEYELKVSERKEPRSDYYVVCPKVTTGLVDDTSTTPDFCCCCKGNLHNSGLRYRIMKSRKYRPTDTQSPLFIHYSYIPHR